MLEAANYSACETLRNGRRVEIRALRPDDRADLIAAVPMLKVFEKSGLPLSMKREPQVVHVALRLR